MGKDRKKSPAYSPKNKGSATGIGKGSSAVKSPGKSKNMPTGFTVKKSAKKKPQQISINLDALKDFRIETHDKVGRPSIVDIDNKTVYEGPSHSKNVSDVDFVYSQESNSGLKFKKTSQIGNKDNFDKILESKARISINTKTG